MCMSSRISPCLIVRYRKCFRCTALIDRRKTLSTGLRHASSPRFHFFIVLTMFTNILANKFGLDSNCDAISYGLERREHAFLDFCFCLQKFKCDTFMLNCIFSFFLILFPFRYLPQNMWHCVNFVGLKFSHNGFQRIGLLADEYKAKRTEDFCHFDQYAVR